MSIADTNQASEELKQKLRDTKTFNYNVYFGVDGGDYAISFDEAIDEIVSLIRTEKLKLLDKLDKSMPTAEQLTTKYGYHMPQKQYGYKLALHDIREVLTKLEAEL